MHSKYCIFQASRLVPTKNLLLKHDYRRQGKSGDFRFRFHSGKANEFERSSTRGFPNRGVSHFFFREMSRLWSRTLSGLFLVNRENPRTIPEQIGKIPGPSPIKSGKSRANRESPKKEKKMDKSGRTSPDWETPPFETPPHPNSSRAIQDI